MDYYHKYLKYKTKYKLLAGSAESINYPLNEIFDESFKLLIFKNLEEDNIEIVDEVRKILPSNSIITIRMITKTWTQDLFNNISFTSSNLYMFDILEKINVKQIQALLGIRSISTKEILAGDETILQYDELLKIEDEELLKLRDHAYKLQGHKDLIKKKKETEDELQKIKTLERKEKTISLNKLLEYINKDLERFPMEFKQEHLNKIKLEIKNKEEIIALIRIKKNRYIDLLKGGNKINLPRDSEKKFITMVPSDQIVTEREKKTNYIILESYKDLQDSNAVCHVDEILCLIPYSKSTFKVWLYLPEFEDDIQKDNILEIWERNYVYLQSYFGKENIVLFPLLFVKGSIQFPPLFNNIIWNTNFNYKFIFPDQKPQIKEMITAELSKVSENITIEPHYIDTRSSHLLNGNLHCMFKLIPKIPS